MTDQLGLFGDDPPPAARAVGPADPSPAARAAARHLPPGVRLGTSSWSFPGWAGLVWDRETSQRILVREGLPAYAEHPLLRTVGLDRTYYRSLPAEELRAYADDVPADFRFLVKADRLVTSPLDPSDSAIRERNPRFLDAAWAAEAVVEPFRDGMAHRAGPLLFQFSPFPASLVGGAEAFAQRLGAFLQALPPGPLYAVELRTDALLTPDYVEALRVAGAVHAYTVHPAMSPLDEQLRRIPPGRDGPLVVRWMLHAGLKYQAARDRYDPFDRLVDEDLPSRSSIAGAVAAALDAGREAFVVVNNKAEGSAPLSVERLAGRIAEELGGSGSRPADAGAPGGAPAAREHAPDESGEARAAAALRWIVDLLRRHGIPFQVVGGLAARAWGATRPLVDLDLYVPRQGAERILPEIADRITRPLGPVDGEHWRMDFLQLEHGGIQVELGVAEDAWFRNRATRTFERQEVDFDRGVERRVLGLPVPVMPLEELVAYKRKLDRAVDRRDLAELAGVAEDRGD